MVGMPFLQVSEHLIVAQVGFFTLRRAAALSGGCNRAVLVK